MTMSAGRTGRTKRSSRTPRPAMMRQWVAAHGGVAGEAMGAGNEEVDASAAGAVPVATIARAGLAHLSPAAVVTDERTTVAAVGAGSEVAPQVSVAGAADRKDGAPLIWGAHMFVPAESCC
ncbi:hypothetical protein [Rhodococcus wratislaviensis]|uniref:hypothetical protein n=1 Tax=Rhodococcus wratislaviensis TaxID=44752 RepID=UPI00364B40FE